MAPRISDAQRAQYALYRYQMNLARQRAAKMAGVSNAWAVGFDNDMAEDPGELERLLELHPTGDGSIRDPIPHDELSPLAAALLDDFEQWRYKVMGRASRPWAVEAAHQVAELFESPNREFCVINTAPGIGKTTAFTLDIPAWLTCRSRSIRGVLGAIKAPLAARYTRRLRMEFEREVPLRAGAEAREQRGASDAVVSMAQLYGRFKPLKPSVWRADGFIVETEDMAARTEKEFTWLAASMEEDFIGDRVNFQSWDDAASRASTRSVEIRERHFAQWEVIEDRLEPNGLLLLVMQRLGIIDLSRYALDKRVTREIEGGDGDELEELPKYHHIVLKAHYDDRCKLEHSKDAPAYPEGCLLDPSGLPWRDLAGKMSNKAEFMLVYQQDDSADPEATFKHVWIHGGREEASGILFPGCWDAARDPGEIPYGISDDTLSYCAVDPSASGYWVVSWFLYDRLTQLRYLVDMRREKMGANDLLDMMPGSSEYRGIMEDWQARSVSLGRRIRYWIVEHNSQQRWLSQYEWARQWYTSRGVKVISHQTYAYSKLDGDLGVEGSLPRLFEGGTIRLPGSPKGRLQMRPFVDELLHWGAHPTNDTVMAAWMGEYNLPSMLKQPDEDDWEAPVMWRPSWMKRDGEMRRSQLAMMKLSGYRDADDVLEQAQDWWERQ